MTNFWTVRITIPKTGLKTGKDKPMRSASTRLIGGCVAIGLMSFALVARAEYGRGTAIVKMVKGTASYVDEFGGTHVAMVGTVLKEGWTVKTGPGSSLDMTMDNNGRYLGLFENSVITLNKLRYQPSVLGDIFDTELNLKSGQMLASVSKLLAGAKYEVKTPQGVAHVRGTDFWYDAKSGEIWVVSGTVHFEIQLLDVNVPPPPGSHTEVKTIDIPAGYVLFITREIDMASFRNPGLQPTYENGAFNPPANVQNRILNTPVLGGHYQNAGNTSVTVKGAWFTQLDPKHNYVDLVGTPALVVPSP